MNDLETLRRALRAPAPDPGRLHVAEIMAKGRRLRRRRQAMTAGGFACLAAVLAAAGIGAAHLGRTGPPVPQPPLTAGHSPRHDPNAPYGAVIHTGINKPPGELVFYAVHLHMPQLPGDTFGLMGGYLKAGHLSSTTETNEVNGSDVAPGFHAIESPIGSNGVPTPEFGYYVGRAAKITGTYRGQTVRASLAHWSVNHKVVIFWFGHTDNMNATDVTGLAAFNAHGKRLPSGNSAVGHG